MPVIIEVGANQGQDTERFLSYRDVELYSFEPVPQLAKDLIDRFGSNPKFHLIMAAIDVENGFKQFNISKGGDWGCSSLHQFAPDIHSKWSRGEFNYDETISKMMCIRLDDFVKLYGIKEIDYLHVDAQGNDFNVMKSLGDMIGIVKEGVCEVANHVELYDIEDNTVSVVKPWLESKGFEVRVEADGVGKQCADINGNEVNLFFKRV
jgi:FkbM family methyltransferase